MKHYILTFVGYVYDIWVLRARFPEDSSTWDGCSIYIFVSRHARRRSGYRSGYGGWGVGSTRFTVEVCPHMQLAATPM